MPGRNRRFCASRAEVHDRRAEQTLADDADAARARRRARTPRRRSSARRASRRGRRTRPASRARSSCRGRAPAPTPSARRSSSCSSPGPPRPRTAANAPSRRSVSHARASARKRSCSGVKCRSKRPDGTKAARSYAPASWTPTGIAVVTGASRGIGRAVAIELARARVRHRRDDARSGRRRRPRGEAATGRIRVERLDVNDPATIALPDGLRVLVNNAGVESDNLPLEVMPADVVAHDLRDQRVRARRGDASTRSRSCATRAVA